MGSWWTVCNPLLKEKPRARAPGFFDSAQRCCRAVALRWKMVPCNRRANDEQLETDEQSTESKHNAAPGKNVVQDAKMV